VSRQRSSEKYVRRVPGKVPAAATRALRRAPSPRSVVRALRSRRAGVTLIEIMIVVVIVALGAAAASLGLGSVTRTNLKSACVRLMSLSRYAYHRSLTTGTTVRISLDLARHTFGVSEAHGRIALVRSDAPLREAARDDDDDKKGSQDPGAAIDAWSLARMRLEKPEDTRLPSSPFELLTNPSGKVMDRFKTQPLGDNIRIHKVIVAHEAAPKTDGSTDLFYFPSGLTQHTVVQLTDKSDTIFSVEIHPLTGKGTVHDAPFEPEVLMDDPNQRGESASELEDR
jgi:type II secretion system protein H